MKSFCQEVIERGLEYSHRYSDLYVKHCKELDELLELYPQFKRGLRVSFTSKLDGQRWSEFPFLYEPYWVERGVTCM
jgi:hypothetical protein